MREGPADGRPLGASRYASAAVVFVVAASAAAADLERLIDPSSHLPLVWES